ncbi:hypothetical protein PABG_12240 [Paracoccidioides brasiliensis Pb03]|nr:hypothetical protein PABG_12240 [Paracoccidioides brasiliensis Pb03]
MEPRVPCFQSGQSGVLESNTGLVAQEAPLVSKAGDNNYVEQYLDKRVKDHEIDVVEIGCLPEAQMRRSGDWLRQTN